jgi:predicted patatin/cPLA2 family phospholipase
MNLPKSKPGKKVLLVEGGGMKGSFSGGVLTSLNVYYPAQNYDLIVAVSSGACSAAYYATIPEPQQEYGENLLNIWRKELAGSKLISFLNPFKGRTLLDQKYLVDYLFGKKYPLPKENLKKKGLPEFRIAVCNLLTRQLEYVQATANNILPLLKAATALPIATRGKHRVDGKLYCDAAILNPLPLKDLIKAGYNDITVVMNSPLWLESLPLTRFTRFLSFPFNRKISKLMKEMHHFHFNEARSIASSPPSNVKLHIIAPDDILSVGLVTTKQKLLEETVELGKLKGIEASEKLNLLKNSVKPRKDSRLKRKVRKKKKSKV